MTLRITRRRALPALSAGGLLSAGVFSLLARAGEGIGRASDSMYRLEFSYPLENLVGDLQFGERADPRREAEVPFHEWYSAAVRRRFGAWGPKPRTYFAPAGLEQQPTEWKRERLVAVAARFIGYGYQHHHIPDWNPPADWPWKETCVGHNGRGVDCSNLTSFVYNQGFGVRMSSAVERQSRLHEAQEGGYALRLRRIDLPDDYDERRAILRTGDLVYIRGREDGPITHVVIWVGEVGRAASGVPLVIDSHGSGVTDDQGRPIPCGVQLRPFRSRSWYNRCASHAHRIFYDEAN